MSDLTEHKLKEHGLSYLENYDPLTDLPNRFYYNYQLHQYLISQQDSLQQLAVIRLNIDRFRPLNEYLSNNGGDELLRQVAQRLRITNAEALIVAHLNGDDFAIVYEILIFALQSKSTVNVSPKPLICRLMYRDKNILLPCRWGFPSILNMDASWII